MRTHGVILVALTVSLLPGCGSPPLKDAIVGKWREVGGRGEVIEFAADGTVTCYYEAGKTRREELTGTYSVEEDRVKLRLSGREWELTAVTVNRDEMSCRTPPANAEIRYRRVR